MQWERINMYDIFRCLQIGYMYLLFENIYENGKKCIFGHLYYTYVTQHGIWCP